MPSDITYSEEEQKELLLRIAEGDEAAFARLFHTWATPLAAIARRMLQHEALCQDVVQEVFIKVWLNRDKLGEVEKLSAWLRKITINQCLQALEKNAANDKRLADLQLVQSVTPREEQGVLELKELRHIIDHTIASLPAQRKAIYLMNRVEGKTTKQIAEELQLSHGYVRNALSAALSAIREKVLQLTAGTALCCFFYLS